jgi:hypothetical protein
MLLQSACSVARDHEPECEPPDPEVHMVAVPITPACKAKMTALADQLRGCENQWRWIPENLKDVDRVNRVIANLSSRQSLPWMQRVSWLQVRDTCKDLKKACFLGLETDTDFAAMQCQL